MSSRRNLFGVLTLVSVLSAGSYLLANNSDRTLPSDKDKAVEQTYSGSQDSMSSDKKPTLEPSMGVSADEEKPIRDRGRQAN